MKHREIVVWLLPTPDIYRQSLRRHVIVEFFIIVVSSRSKVNKTQPITHR